MILDRKKKPRTHQIKKLVLPAATLNYLDNGIPVYQINMGLQEIVRVELMFLAGRTFESKKMASRVTSSLLKEGTTQRDSASIAEIIDFYGASLSTPFNIDTSNVVMHCLSKYYDDLLPVLAEVTLSPAFAETELKTYIENNIQTLQIDLTKNDIVAYRQITESLYGEASPYGYNSTEDLYRSITRADLVAHYEKNFTAANCCIFLSGKLTPQMLVSLNTHFGKMPLGERNKATPNIATATPTTLFLPAKDTLQTAIKIGRRTFSRKHPDYAGFFVLNTILGGYFGSRLMENIREEKGYTYNIYSTLEGMVHDGYFYIATEVGNEFVDATIQEIYKEIELLQTKLVPKSELKMVKSYLLGNMLSIIDGPINVAEAIKSYVMEENDVANFTSLVATIQNISSEEIQAMATKYLQKKDLWQVVVGEKDVEI